MREITPETIKKTGHTIGKKATITIYSNGYALSFNTIAVKILNMKNDTQFIFLVEHDRLYYKTVPRGGWQAKVNKDGIALVSNRDLIRRLMFTLGMEYGKVRAKLEIGPLKDGKRLLRKINNHEQS